MGKQFSGIIGAYTTELCWTYLELGYVLKAGLDLGHVRKR